jgi:hypothetical protein
VGLRWKCKKIWLCIDQGWIDSGIGFGNRCGAGEIFQGFFYSFARILSPGLIGLPFGSGLLWLGVGRWSWAGLGSALEISRMGVGRGSSLRTIFCGRIDRCCMGLGESRWILAELVAWTEDPAPEALSVNSCAFLVMSYSKG